MKKLYRSKTDRVLLGVCSGIAAYFDIDPTLVRVIWALLALSGTGILAYLLCGILIPEEPF